MKLLLRIFSYIIGNFIGLYAASYLLPAFQITPNPEKILVVALFLLAGNIFIKPILKLLLSPLIILTLGLFMLVINGFVLYLIDFISDYITINGIGALLYGSVIISLSTMLVAWSAHIFIKDQEQQNSL